MRKMRNAHVLCMLMALLLCMLLSGCVRAEKVDGKIDVPPFTILIEDTMYTNSTFEDLQVYECTATSTNRYGTEETYTYTGYRLTDVLDTVHVSSDNGITSVGSDGYEVRLTEKETEASTTLLAFLRDGEASAEDGTVFVVPCKSDYSPDYAKVVTEIMMNEAA